MSSIQFDASIVQSKLYLLRVFDAGRVVLDVVGQGWCSLQHFCCLPRLQGHSRLKDIPGDLVQVFCLKDASVFSWDFDEKGTSMWPIQAYCATGNALCTWQCVI